MGKIHFFCSQSFSKCHASCLATRQKERKQQTGVSELIAPPKTDMIMGNPYFQSEIHLQMVHVSFLGGISRFLLQFFSKLSTTDLPNVVVMNQL